MTCEFWRLEENHWKWVRALLYLTKCGLSANKYLHNVKILSLMREKRSMFSLGLHLILSTSHYFVSLSATPWFPDKWMHSKDRAFLKALPISLMRNVFNPVDVRSMCCIALLCLMILPIIVITSSYSFWVALLSEMLFQARFKYWSRRFALRIWSMG